MSLLEDVMYLSLFAYLGHDALSSLSRDNIFSIFDVVAVSHVGGHCDDSIYPRAMNGKTVLRRLARLPYTFSISYQEEGANAS